MLIQSNMDAESAIKSQMINSYLSDQSTAVQPLPDNNSLEEFKNQVKMWMEIDNTVKKLQNVIKERNAIKNQLTRSILAFMSRFNIEDLNTKEGKLRYKVTNVKAPLNQTVIKNRLEENFSKARNAEELHELVFNRDIVVQKHSLRRLRPKNASTQ